VIVFFTAGCYPSSSKVMLDTGIGDHNISRLLVLIIEPTINQNLQADPDYGLSGAIPLDLILLFFVELSEANFLARGLRPCPFRT
jgi:hypothetical protein